MTCLRPLLAKQPQCRKTCSSVNQPMTLQSIQHVWVKYLMQYCCNIKALCISVFHDAGVSVTLLQPWVTSSIPLVWELALVLVPAWVRLSNPLDLTCSSIYWVLMVQILVDFLQPTLTQLHLTRVSLTSVSTKVNGAFMYYQGYQARYLFFAVIFTTILMFAFASSSPWGSFMILFYR